MATEQLPEQHYPLMVEELKYMRDTNYPFEKVTTRPIDLQALQMAESQENATCSLTKQLALRIHPSYQVTFGIMWGEGGIDRRTGRTISLDEFLNMTNENRENYSLFYEPSAFATRFKHELFPQKGKGYISIAEDETGRVVGAAWGVKTTVKKTLERIGTANYTDTAEHTDTWRKVAPQLEEAITTTMVKRGVKSDTVLYWDEVYTLPSLHKSGLGMQLMSELLSSIITDSPINEPLPLVFRTSEASDMASIADALVKIGVFNKITPEGDDSGIVYYAGAISPWLLAAARVATPNRVFRSMLRASKSATMAHDSD